MLCLRAARANKAMRVRSCWRSLFGMPCRHKTRLNGSVIGCATVQPNLENVLAHACARVQESATKKRLLVAQKEEGGGKKKRKKA